MPLGANKVALFGASGVVKDSAVLLATGVASASASLVFTIPATYKQIAFGFYNIAPATNNVHFQFNGSTDGGSNYNVTKTTTIFHAYNNEAGSDTSLGYDAGYDLAQSTSDQILAPGIGNLADECAAGEMYLFNPPSTTYVKQFYSTLNAYFHGDYTHESFTAGYLNTTSAVNGIKFLMSSGNFDGTIKMWGIK